MKKYSLLIVFTVLISTLFLGINVNANETYTVTFDIYKGKQLETVSVSKNNLVSKPSDPDHTGYIFGGWYKDNNYTVPYDFNTPVTSNITIYAKWDVKKFNVTFNTNGAGTIPNQIVNYRTKVIEPKEPVKKGYYFAGWYKDEYFENKFSFLTEVKEDLNLYAYFVTEPRNTYDVTFVPGLGVDPFITEIDKGGYVDSPAIDMESDAIKTDEAIYGTWYINPEKTIPYNFDNPVNSDLVLYGKWTTESGTEILEAPDTASKAGIIYTSVGIVLVLGAIYIIIKLVKKPKNKGV